MAKKPVLQTDSIYVKALAALNRQRKQAATLAMGALAQNTADYNTALLPFSTANYNTGRRQINEDAAGRGMLTSTGTGQSLADFLNKWNAEKATIKRTRDRGNFNAVNTKNVTYGSIDDQKQQALEDLIQRNNARKLSGK